MAESLDYVNEAMRSRKQLHHSLVNAGKIFSMQTDSELRKSVMEADLMINLLELSYQRGYSCYFLGAKEKVVKKGVDIYSEKYTDKVIAGYQRS